MVTIALGSELSPQQRQELVRIAERYRAQAIGSDSMPFSEREAGRSDFLVALEGERVIGFLQGRIDQRGNKAIVLNHCVIPEMQRRGLGSQLWNSFRERARHFGVNTEPQPYGRTIPGISFTPKRSGEGAREPERRAVEPPHQKGVIVPPGIADRVTFTAPKEHPPIPPKRRRRK